MVTSTASAGDRLELRCSACRGRDWDRGGRGASPIVGLLEGGVVLRAERIGQPPAAIKGRLLPDSPERRRFVLVEDQDAPRLRCDRGHRLALDERAIAGARRLGDGVAYLPPA